MELSPATRRQAMGGANRLVQLLRRYPLASYFLLAFSFTWAYELTVYRTLLPPNYNLFTALLDLGFTLGPTLAALLVIASTQGQAGIRQVLRRCTLWRVGIAWYSVAFLAAPALVLIVVLLLPGALSVFSPPAPSFWLTVPLIYLLFLVAEGALGEEPGWRGFALPRLQQRLGPLGGTLLLGALWGLWHLPMFFIPGSDWYALSIVGTGVAGHLTAFIAFCVWVTAMSIVITWVFNNTRGSMLLAMFMHVSNNAATFVILTLFPLSPDKVSLLLPGLVLGWVVAALFVIAATRGRLSYQRYLREQ
jgi:membrane protease YdiL (CAAX protease family)